MQNSNPELVVSHVSRTWGSLLVLTGFVLIGMAIGNILALVVLALYFSADFGSLTNLITQLINHPEQVTNGWYGLMILQGTVHFFSYLLPSAAFWMLIEKRTISDLSPVSKPALPVWLLGCILVLVFIPLNSKFIEWNASMQLPESLASLEKWMRDKEDQLSVMTAFLTRYTHISQLLIALFVITMLPALGEEMLFRGVLQNKLLQVFRNPHVAIWVSAAIFSAIHFQFYGFLPRMTLGALFGYLYYWTGNFWVAVLGHFINNAFVLIMVHLKNQQVIRIDIEETDALPFPLVLASVVLSFAILSFIRRSGRDRGISFR